MINVITFPRLGLSFTINRAAINIGSFSIYWYGLLITFGMLLAILYGIRESKKSGISSDDFFNMLIIAIPVSIICARAYYVIFSWDIYKNNILDIFDIRGGGLAIYGGVIGAALTVIIYCRTKKLNLGAVLDMLAVGLLIGQAIGRWGNFVNGEAFGATTSLPWGMTIQTDGKVIAESVHPTFFYESVWNFIGVGVLLLYKKHKRFSGELFCAYMVWYGAGRTIIEGLRADSLYLGPIRVSQLLAAMTVIVGIILIICLRKRESHMD